MERLPGFRDFYPEPLPSRDAGWSADARNYIFDTWRSVARRYGFREYDGPPLEPLELYTTKSGEEIVGQLYNFTDKGDRAVALRPEMTPTLARMIAAHARNYRKPINSRNHIKRLLYHLLQTRNFQLSQPHQNQCILIPLL